MTLNEQLQPKQLANLVVELRKQYHPQLYCYTIGLCKKFRKDKSFAEDLLQRLYLKILTSPNIVRKGYEKLKLPYLMSMIRNDLYNIDKQLKAWKRQEELYCLYISSASHQDESLKEYLFTEMNEIMKEQLSGVEYEVMLLYIEGYKMKEIGCILNMNPSTIGVKIYRAKRKLEPFFPKL